MRPYASSYAQRPYEPPPRIEQGRAPTSTRTRPGSTAKPAKRPSSTDEAVLHSPARAADRAARELATLLDVPTRVGAAVDRHLARAARSPAAREHVEQGPATLGLPPEQRLALDARMGTGSAVRRNISLPHKLVLGALVPAPEPAAATRSTVANFATVAANPRASRLAPAERADLDRRMGLHGDAAPIDTSDPTRLVLGARRNG
jgi:hypothetical protein